MGKSIKAYSQKKNMRMRVLKKAVKRAALAGVWGE